MQISVSKEEKERVGKEGVGGEGKVRGRREGWLRPISKKEQKRGRSPKDTTRNQTLLIFEKVLKSVIPYNLL